MFAAETIAQPDSINGNATFSKCSDYCQKSIKLVTIPGLENDLSQLHILAEMPLKTFCDQYVITLDDDRAGSGATTDFPIDTGLNSLMATSSASKDFVSHLKEDFSHHFQEIKKNGGWLLPWVSLLPG